jgi:hypothetical protein
MESLLDYQSSPISFEPEDIQMEDLTLMPKLTEPAPMDTDETFTPHEHLEPANENQNNHDAEQQPTSKAFTVRDLPPDRTIEDFYKYVNPPSKPSTTRMPTPPLSKPIRSRWAQESAPPSSALPTGSRPDIGITPRRIDFNASSAHGKSSSSAASGSSSAASGSSSAASGSKLAPALSINCELHY